MSQNYSALEELKDIYGDVSEWLKFVETKHAATFAVWTAMIIGLLSSERFWKCKIIIQILLVLPVLIGMLINILAFLPFINRSEQMKRLCWKKYHNVSSENTVFYQTIFTSVYSYVKPEITLEAEVDRYKQMMKSRLGDVSFGELETDYMKQIIETATVATIKVYLFELEIKYILALLAVVCVGLLIA